MPKQPKNKNNELRQLRGQLATQGRTRISQKELAKICGVSEHQIKKVEFGTRQLTADTLAKIEFTTGASWDHKRSQWTRYDKKPFTFDDFKEHRRSILNPTPMDQAIQRGKLATIHCRINWLFENVPATSWEKLRVLVDQSLEKHKRDLKLTKNDALFSRPWATTVKDSAYALFMNLEQQFGELEVKRLENEVNKLRDCTLPMGGEKHAKDEPSDLHGTVAHRKRGYGPY